MPGGGQIPGYAGYIPGMKNHLIGKRYTEATLKAEKCQELLGTGGNPSGMVDLVESRPQGRNFLYAQVATTDNPTVPVLAPAHVGKRRPLLNEALGEKDFRLQKTVVAGHEPHPMKIEKSASLPKLPYQSKKFFTGQEGPFEEGDTNAGGGNLPGYTGHQHGSQHIYGLGYGLTTKALADDGGLDMCQRSNEFLAYGEGRPVGSVLTEKHRIPGYQGYIPGKDNHIYSKTYGTATNLAPLAEETMKAGGNASGLQELVDNRPQGRTALYAQGQATPFTKEPLKVHVSKGVVRTQFYHQGQDYKYREKTEADIKLVQKAKHRIVGYTGHVHGQQHVYAESFGKMTRKLHGGQTNLSEPGTTDALLMFKDDRPNAPGS